MTSTKLALLTAALAMGASAGVPPIMGIDLAHVPTSDVYVRRKLGRSSQGSSRNVAHDRAKEKARRKARAAGRRQKWRLK